VNDLFSKRVFECFGYLFEIGMASFISWSIILIFGLSHDYFSVCQPVIIFAILLINWINWLFIVPFRKEKHR
jgi:hypothetical protein